MFFLTICDNEYKICWKIHHILIIIFIIQFLLSLYFKISTNYKIQIYTILSTLYKLQYLLESKSYKYFKGTI